MAGNGSLKRKHHDKENSSPRKRKRDYTPRRTIQQKLETVFEHIRKLNWTLATTPFGPPMNMAMISAGPISMQTVQAIFFKDKANLALPTYYQILEGYPSYY